jgi:hypothetical protein
MQNCTTDTELLLAQQTYKYYREIEFYYLRNWGKCDSLKNTPQRV